MRRFVIDNELQTFVYFTIASILDYPHTWNRAKLSEKLKLQMRDTCVAFQRRHMHDGSCGIVYTNFVMESDSGDYLATFEVKNPDSEFLFIGVAPAAKMENFVLPSCQKLDLS